MPFQSTTHLRYEPDYKGEILGLIDADLRIQPRIKALMEGLAHGTQIAEDDAFTTLISLVLDTSTHHQLARWGAIVGEQRGGLIDDDYRRFISARMLANRTASGYADMLEILSLITGTDKCFIRDLAPPGYEMWFVHEEAFDDALAGRVSRFMDDVKPAGKPLLLVEAVTGYFGFELDPWALGFDEGLFARTI
jgi:hypothetical protein